MKCRRCGSNVPDFLWQGDDHPVIVEGGMMIVNMDPPRPQDNTVKVTASMRVGIRSCKEFFPRIETLEVNGVECVVIHLVESHLRPLIASCTGNECKFPEENDKRPVTLCERCRRLATDGRTRF